MNLGECSIFRTGYRTSVKDTNKEHRKAPIGGYEKGKRRRQSHGVRRRADPQATCYRNRELLSL